MRERQNTHKHELDKKASSGAANNKKKKKKELKIPRSDNKNEKGLSFDLIRLKIIKIHKGCCAAAAAAGLTNVFPPRVLIT